MNPSELIERHALLGLAFEVHDLAAGQAHRSGGENDPRLLTAILYLSGDVDGGRFRSYKATEDVVEAEIEPSPGTFVCFWSDRLVHDVSAVTRLDEARWALTVWLCTDEDIVEATPDEVPAAHWPHLRDS